MKALILSTAVIIGLWLSSCEGCKPEEQPAPTHEATFTEKVEKKWTVSTAAIRTSGTAADYTSFEFTDNGTFFIIKADRSFLRGDFTLNVGDSSVLMNGVGTIYIDEITETEITFRLVLTGTTEEITVSATPATPVTGTTTTTSTAHFTNTNWSFRSRSIDGVVEPIITNYFADGTKYLYVILSDYGTYSVETNVPGNPNTVGIWIYCDAAQTIFSGSSDPTVQPVCSSNSNAISFDSNGNLLLTRIISGQTHVDTYEALP